MNLLSKSKSELKLKISEQPEKPHNVTAINFFHVAVICNINPCCLACSVHHFSNDCPLQTTTELRKTPPKCVNCGLQKPPTIKVAQNSPLSTIQKTFAEATATRPPSQFQKLRPFLFKSLKKENDPTLFSTFLLDS